MMVSPRLRRIRSSPALRRMTAENRILPEDLVQPVFVDERIEEERPIGCLPGISAHPLSGVADHVKYLEECGVQAIMLFGIPSIKDKVGSSAYDADGVAQRAIRSIKESSDMIIMADVCLCEYTDHGHCGVISDGQVADEETLPLLQRTAITLAAAGADLVAPSGMMDGAVLAIREGLDAAGHTKVPIMAYAAKYNSAFYGPFREAACSAPQMGDRSSYQIDVSNSREALRSVARDLEAGADIIMVKPAISSLDIIRECRELHDHPVAAYQVSGEYAMIMSAGAQGMIDGRRAMEESLTAIKRAGADIIISYYAREFISNHLRGFHS